VTGTSTQAVTARAGQPRLPDRVTLITGAASGIGEATARRFAAEGARVVLFDLQEERVRKLAAELNGIAVGGDAADADDAAEAVSAAVGAYGGLDVLVTCAGGNAGFGALADLTPQDWDAGISVNLETAVTTTQAALPALLERRGTIVLVSSVGALSSGPRSIAYQTAKAALVGFAHCVAVDYSPLGIRVNVVCPGRTLTPMVETMTAQFAREKGLSPEEMEAVANAATPLRRSAQPAELANVCLFLAGDDSSFMTGSVVVADGGIMATNVGVIPFLNAYQP
jgi:meso-butanediol dehydrogenase / (S,S)-butanediol dehydrogenase / diacetyl reductase